MTHLPPVVLGLLRRLLSSGFVIRSIKRLLILFSYLQRLFTKKRTTQEELVRTQDPATDFVKFAGSTTRDVICYSNLPASQIETKSSDTTSPSVPNDHAHIEIPMTNIVHARPPQPGYLLPYAYGQNASSRSSQAVVSIPDSNRVSIISDESGIHSRRSNLDLSAIDLPISNHGLVQKSPLPHPHIQTGSPISQQPASVRSGRPDCRNSNASSSLRKVSRPPSPAPHKHFPSPIRSSSPLPADDRPHDENVHSPQNFGVVIPMSTHSVGRRNRNIIVYVAYSFPSTINYDTEMT